MSKQLSDFPSAIHFRNKLTEGSVKEKSSLTAIMLEMRGIGIAIRLPRHPVSDPANAIAYSLFLGVFRQVVPNASSCKLLPARGVKEPWHRCVRLRAIQYRTARLQFNVL